MMVPSRGVITLVCARIESELVRNDKVEGNSVCVSSLEDTRAGEVGSSQGHAKPHKSSIRIGGILVDKVNASIRNASKANLKLVKGDIAGGRDDDLSNNGGARGISLGGPVLVNLDVHVELVALGPGTVIGRSHVDDVLGDFEEMGGSD